MGGQFFLDISNILWALSPIVINYYEPAERSQHEPFYNILIGQDGQEKNEHSIINQGEK